MDIAETPRCTAERRSPPGDCQPLLSAKFPAKQAISRPSACGYATRRGQSAAAVSFSLPTPFVAQEAALAHSRGTKDMADPVVIATWPFGQTAAKQALPI